MVPVATQATVKTLSSEEVLQTDSQLLICNTFHLHLKPGEAIVKAGRGLHQFMHWPKPIMTDSGGFQVFSLGFGLDHNMGKILNDADYRRNFQVREGTQPQRLKITERGVMFRSPFDGQQIFLGPKESIRIQQKLGADIMFAFDECPPPTASYEYLKQSVARTNRWALVCLKARTSKQALYGIVQGGKYKDLRQQSAAFISSQPFDGFGIGGELGEDRSAMVRMMRWVTDVLPAGKPRHLLGNGHPEDIRNIVTSGVDTFDCIVPTHYARHGVAFTSAGRLTINKTMYLHDRKPLDSKCGCDICHNYTRSYITHLFRAKEITGMKLVTLHNLHYFHELVQKLRVAIKAGKV
jgi:queuine tRNA-ribosyltransferase